MSEQVDRDALAEVLRDDGPIEAVGAAIWQANSELTKPEYRNMPDAEARTYFAHAAIDATFASDWLAQRDRRVAAEALREAAGEIEADARSVDPVTLRDRLTFPAFQAVMRVVCRWLRERADRIERGE